MPKKSDIVLAERIAGLIYFVRSQKVLLDSDLAKLYGVETRVLNQAVQRNIDRFPKDFCFQLTLQEFRGLISQSVISNSDVSRGGRRKMPFVFTEQGVAMLSSVLNSKQAIEVNIAIMRTFVKLREILANNKLLADKILAMEKKYDEQFKVVFEAIRQLLGSTKKTANKQIGFGRDKK